VSELQVGHETSEKAKVDRTELALLKDKLNEVLNSKLEIDAVETVEAKLTAKLDQLQNALQDEISGVWRDTTAGLDVKLDRTEIDTFLSGKIDETSVQTYLSHLVTKSDFVEL
jgi:hypothetical protein